MAINQVPGVGPQNSDIAASVVTAGTSAGFAATGASTSDVISAVTTYAASAGLTASAIVTAGNAAGWASAAPSYPLGATSVVFSGYSSTGTYAYSSNVSAGSYIVQAPSSVPDGYMVVWAPNSSVSTMIKTNGTDMGIIRLSTTENPVNFTAFGKISPIGNLRIANSGQSINTGKNQLGYANGWFFHCNTNNRAWISNDGANWSSYVTPGSNPYGTYSTGWDGTYYMVGYYDAYFRSTDLVNWSSTAVTGVYDIYKMLYRAANTQKYIFVGGGGIFTSPNGTTWTARITGVNTWKDVETNNAGTYVAVGLPNASAGPKLYYSTNEGVNWTSVANLTQVFSTSGELTNVAYGNGVWVVAGNAYDGTNATTVKSISMWSTDGVNWRTGSFHSGAPYTTAYSIFPQGRYTQFLEFVNGVFIWCVSTGTPTVYKYFWSLNGKEFTECTPGTFPLYNVVNSGVSGITKSLSGGLGVVYYGQNSDMLSWGHSLYTQNNNKVGIYMYSIPSQTVLN